jgi:hypothetical protein
LQPTEADIEAAKEELVQDMLAKLEEVSRVFLGPFLGLPGSLHVLSFAADIQSVRSMYAIAGPAAACVKGHPCRAENGFCC